MLLSACADDKEDDTSAGDGTVTWTHNGATYTSTVYSSAIVDGTNELIITSSSSDQKNVVPFSLQGIGIKGAATFR